MLLVRRNKEVIKMNVSKYNNEESLMALFKESIETLIPLETIGSENEDILAHRLEFPVSSGSIDLLAISNIGSLYIVETKLFRNKTRREVIAQALDYAAGIWEDYVDNTENFIDAILDKYHDDEKSNLKNIILDTCIDKNLREASFNIIVVMDSIDMQTKSLIEFLNKHTDFKILGLEIMYYCNDNLEVLQPHVYGEEIKKEIKSVNMKKNWSFNSLKDLFEMIEGSEKTRMLDLLNWAQEIGAFASVTSDRPIFSLKLKNGKFIYFTKDGNISALIGYQIKSYSSEKLRSEFVEGLKLLGFLNEDLEINDVKSERKIKKTIHELDRDSYSQFKELINDIIQKDNLGINFE